MTIAETLIAEPPPLYVADEGVVRVTGTRVSLDTVIVAFQNGCTAVIHIRPGADAHACCCERAEKARATGRYATDAGRPGRP